MFDDWIGPLCGIVFLAEMLAWLRDRIPLRPLEPWPGFWAASWRFNAGRRRAVVIQGYPVALCRYGWLSLLDRWRRGFA